MSRRGACRRPSCWLAVILLGISLLCWATLSMLQIDAGARRYEALSAESGTEAPTDIDWESLRQANSDVCAWVTVTNTCIDHPVCQASDDGPEFYLDHDLWGNYEFAGCPYLDHRCDAKSPHCIVLGHHLLWGGMFSDIYQCFRQEELDRVLGGSTLTWSTPDGESVTMRPVCASSVDAGYQPIQQFDFGSVTEMRAWLAEVDLQADAHAADAQETIGRAERVVTLVTCSSSWGGSPYRTLVTFAGTL